MPDRSDTPTPQGPNAAGEDQARLAALDQDQLATLYTDLRKHAQTLLLSERGGHTLQPTALVNEAICKLMGERAETPAPVPRTEPADGVHERRRLFGALSHRMRQVLVEHARRRNSSKREGRLRRTPLDEAWTRAASDGVDLERLDLALGELERSHPESAEVFQLRWCGGLSMEHLAQVLQVSSQEAQQRWTRARRLMAGILRPGAAAHE